MGNRPPHPIYSHSAYCSQMSALPYRYRPGQNGIDGVYRNPNPPPDYVITEAKYGSSQLNRQLADGTNQMVDVWDGERLDNIVGRQQGDAIRAAMRAGRVQKMLLRTSHSGSLAATYIDGAGYLIRGKAGQVSGI